MGNTFLMIFTHKSHITIPTVQEPSKFNVFKVFSVYSIIFWLIDLARIFLWIINTEWKILDYRDKKMGTKFIWLLISFSLILQEIYFDKPTVLFTKQHRISLHKLKLAVCHEIRVLNESWEMSYNTIIAISWSSSIPKKTQTEFFQTNQML